MESFLYYLLRASVLMALFYGFYKFFFAKTTFHAINRFLLVGTAWTILLLPLFRFNLIPEKRREPVVFDTLPIDFSSIPMVEAVEGGSMMEIPWIPLLMGLFAAGLLFTVIRYLIGLNQIVAIIRESEERTFGDGIVLCLTHRNISPFSWMKYIVLSQKEFSNDNGAIVRHEKAHVFLRHSRDMILFDLLTCLFWFHPFSWLLRREIQSVHEYQANERVLDKGIDPKQYQLLLIRKSVGEYKFALANNFRRRDLHKRIAMMMKNKTNQRMKWNYAMALPVLFLAMIALSVPKLNANILEKESDDATENKRDILLQTKDTMMITPPLVDLFANSPDVGRTKVFTKDSIATDSIKNIKFAIKGIDGKSNLLIIVDEKKITPHEFQEMKPDDIESISILKNKAVIDIYGDEGKNGVILVKTKKNEKEAPETGSLVLESSRNEVVVVRYGTMDSLRGDMKKVTTRTLGDRQPLYILDGTPISGAEMQSIKPDDIESVSVLKNKSAIDIYGDKGKDGVVLISTKKESGTISLNRILKDKPLIIIDDEKMAGDFELDSIDPNDIESISVLKAESATTIYGDEGKNGVIIITKKNSERMSKDNVSPKGSAD